jgi:uncharacterized surface protein with fasciclin (FAS1) repeats
MFDRVSNTLSVHVTDRGYLFNGVTITTFHLVEVTAAYCDVPADSLFKKLMEGDAVTTTTTTEAAATAATATETVAGADPKMLGAFGAACSAVPADGDGSFAGMAQAPAATAAAANPLLSTLVAAVTAAGLGDTLNGPGPFTIFAPTNDAFAKIDKATLDALLADPKGDLTKILTFHVIPGKALKAADLLTTGSEMTVQGSAVSITGSGQDLTINGNSKVICGDVPVANGIVHIVDTVLLPN